jgi:signal transduction histidine kinase
LQYYGLNTVLLKSTKLALVFKSKFSGFLSQTSRWLTFPRLQIALAAVCIVSVLLTCLLALAAIGWLQQRDSFAAAESTLDRTLVATGALLNTANLNSLCDSTAALAVMQSAFISFKGAINCTVPPRLDYAAVTSKALEGDIYPYDQFYSIRGSDKFYRLKSISFNLASGPLLVTVGEPVLLLAEGLARFGVLLSILLLLLAFLGGLASMAIVRVYLRPLTAMSQEIRKIHILHKQAKLGHKLSSSTNAEELNSVARAFNELLGTLETNLIKYHEFASNAAHEIRTSLMVISSIAQRSILQARSGLQLSSVMPDILDEVDHLSRLTQGLLLLAQLENRSKVTDVSPELVQPIVEQCIETMTALAEDKGQMLVMSSFEQAEVWADRTMLKQAVMNLIHNAIVHCARGAIIKIGLESALPSTTTIAISDNGPGIPIDKQERIFDRFATVSRKVSGESGTPAHRGLGLGLSIVKALVEAQGGTLKLESEPNQGSKFLIHIPTAGFYTR